MPADHPPDGARRPPCPAGPCAMVLFGATGDLARRLVIPALYNLSRTGLLPDDFALIGVARAAGTAQSWCEQLHTALTGFVGGGATFDPAEIDEPAWSRLASRMSYVRGDLTDADLYSALREALAAAETRHGTLGHVVFYLAVADALFATVIDQLGKAGLTDQGGKAQTWRRVVVEKPFGHDLASARALNADIRRTLAKDQIYRIDHFLGKDTVQSILAFRFANGLFEPIWNRDRIDHVQITVAETLGVEHRGGFYEATGAVRDMVPNHVLSLLSMVAMEPPTGFDSAAIRARKADVFAAMPAVDPRQCVRGQYGPGAAKGYRDEAGVARDSAVET